jgi:hypothetical protein
MGCNLKELLEMTNKEDNPKKKFRQVKNKLE